MKLFNGFCLLIAGLILCLITVGCGIPGSPNAPVEDDSVTLIATVTAPEVNSDGILAAAKYSATDVLSVIQKSSICKVNGSKVEFSLNEATREIQIEKVRPAAAYEISLQCGALNLRAIEPHSSRKIVFPSGISLQTTAEWHIFDAYAKEAAVSPAAISGYSPLVTEVNTLANALKLELEKTTATQNSLDSLLSTNLQALMARKSFSEAFARNGTAYNFNGKWAGSVFYYLYSAGGVPAIIVQADAKMTLSCTGTALSGSASLVPVAVVPLLKDMSGVTTPSEIAFALYGTCQNSFARFTRKGNLGPLDGKNIDEWEIFPVNNGIACRVKNLDTFYNSGIKTVPGDFILTKTDK